MAAPHPHACSLSTPCERKRKESFLVSRGKGKKVYELSSWSQTRVSSATHPRLTPAPRAARRWALPPLHFLERWEAGLPPVHFCGRNSHLSTAEHTERMAATPLRP